MECVTLRNAGVHLGPLDGNSRWRCHVANRLVVNQMAAAFAYLSGPQAQLIMPFTGYGDSHGYGYGYGCGCGYAPAACVSAPLYLSRTKRRRGGVYFSSRENLRQLYGGCLTKVGELWDWDMHSSLRLQRSMRGGWHRNNKRCMFPRASAGNGGVHEFFSEEDKDYVNATVLEAVEVRSGLDGFYMKMYDGTYVKCVHNSADGGRLPDYPAQPAIILQLNDGSNLLLPILVLELPQTMLIEALRNVPSVRPTVYHVMRDLVELMQYEVKLVRVTHRVMEAYHARIFLKSWGDGHIISLDMRPSDAVNLAVRCKVPIQINKHLAAEDGVRIVQDSHSVERRPTGSDMDMDRPEESNSPESEEFVLVRNMIVAAVEERYNDAARLRDQLKQLRSKQPKKEA